MNEVGNDHGHHSADDRIDEFQQQNCRHDRNEVAAVDAAHDGQEFAFDLEEHAHVEDAPDRNQDPGKKAQPAAVFALEVLRHGHQPQRTKTLDDQTRTPHDDHDESGNQRRSKGGEAILVAQFAVVHERDRADLGGRKRRNACIRPEFSSGNEVVGYVANVFLAQKSGRDGQDEIGNDNEPVNGGEVHSVLRAVENWCVWFQDRTPHTVLPFTQAAVTRFLKCSSTLP